MMNARRTLTVTALLCTLVLVAACRPSTSTPIASGGPITGYTSLVDNLRAAGAAVEAAGEIAQDFFSVKGQVIVVNGADVQVFEYESDAAAEKEAALISSTGSSIGTTMVSWVGTPHFYASGRTIALYVGDEAAVTAVLEEVLGPQVAGG